MTVIETSCPPSQLGGSSAPRREGPEFPSLSLGREEPDHPPDDRPGIAAR
jgi:hypothetical protein